ncbi:tannase/feruloyl esterase family alpha/beta hydrolase [Burkholderiaceae bacterium UC74_6]
MRSAYSFALASLACLTTLAAHSAQAAPARKAAQPLRCEQLAGMAIPADAIALPTQGGRVTEAVLVPAVGSGAAALPEYCKVTAAIAPVDPNAPSIMIRVAMPAQWNHKVVMFGGGGFTGTIPNVAGQVSAGPVDQLTPLGRGYATFSSDSGHQAKNPSWLEGSLEGEFLLNDEALQNFAGHSIKKTHDAALYLLTARYAAGAPKKAYFAGGSTGGRETLQAIQRWPEDWDGAIAWYPGWNQLTAMMGIHRISRILAQPGAYPSMAQRVLLRQAGLEACDALDGLKDGLVSNPVRCNAVFDPMKATVNGKPLRCPGGAAAGDACLSDVQIRALQQINDGDMRLNTPLASGLTGYPGMNLWGSDMGEASNPSPYEPLVTFLNFGTVQPTFPMPAGAPYGSRQEDAVVRYAITRDPAFNSLNFDPENPGPWAGRMSALSAQLDVSSDLSRFVARGGKLLMAHGMADVLVSTRSTEFYFQKLQAQFGPAGVQGFARYYEVPGYGHALSTAFNATWDSLTVLEQWVEQGVAPRQQVTTDTVGVPGRKRPLCEYPLWPKYKGSGDVNAAESFVCANQ